MTVLSVARPLTVLQRHLKLQDELSTKPLILLEGPITLKKAHLYIINVIPTKIVALLP